MQTEKNRIILLLCLVLVVGVLWNAWRQDYQAPVPVLNDNATISNNTQLPQTALNLSNSSQNTAHDKIHVKTDVLDVEINLMGGNIVKTNLLKYPVELNSPKPVVLMNDDPKSLYLAQSALVSSAGESTEHIAFVSDAPSYQLTADKHLLTVNLKGYLPSGKEIVKTYIFYPGQYKINLIYQLNNKTASPWQGSLYTQLSRFEDTSEQGGLFKISSYLGASVSTTKNTYQKVSFKNMKKENINLNSPGGWVAMQQHYFLSAWVPPAKQNNHFYSAVSGDGLYTIGSNGPAVTVAPGQKADFMAVLYAGPELAEPLKAISPHLDLTIDYGMLAIISIAIFWLMQKIYLIVGNWGWSIILVTILIKLLFYKLSATSYRSMAKMRNLQPKIKLIQERYADDRQKLTQATMELYKKEKANPLSGCLPILIQIPVFIALYWVLVETVQLRQAPFILWIHDLSVKDPFYVLPILNGLAMFVQQKLNPPPPDPTQAKVMLLMPIFLTVIFINFPAGLVLYWLVNSACSILQQWYIMKNMEKKPVKAKHKKSK